jgi:hypothetical protein
MHRKGVMGLYNFTGASDLRQKPESSSFPTREECLAEYYRAISNAFRKTILLEMLKIYRELSIFIVLRV